jgi:2'-5' RNA ligase
MVAPDDLHLTLVFLGTQPGSNLALLTDIATNLRGRPFTLCLDQLRCRGGLVLLTPRQVPDELLALQQGLLQALSQAGVAADTRPYHPHLTLARHSRLPANSAACAFTWRVTRFALLVSRQQATGHGYQVLGEWLLRP